jgi:3-oxoacyl-[acyl-carrier-protein] synthase-1
MAERIAITGIGIISSLGLNAAENFNSLINSKTGIGQMELLESVHKELPVAEVKKTDEELARLLQLPYDRKYTRTALLAMLAAQEAWTDACADASSKNGVISATTVAGMRTSEGHYVDFKENGGDAFFINTHDAGDSTEKVADLLGIKDYLSTISTACSSSANSFMLGSRLLRAKKLDKVLAGGVDALSKFTVNGFNSLMILDKEHCRSFDDTRAGLNLGEGAAFLVLERASEVEAGRKIYGYIDGYANANDAYHQTASSPDGNGATLAMQNALKMAQLQPGDIDYINAHGTATNNNDLSEGLAIEKIFGDQIPPVSSTKPYTGHTLAAAGSIEAVFVALALENGFIYPNLNFRQQMQELSFSPNTELKKAELHHVLSNSFGFGGNNSSIIFSKH